MKVDMPNAATIARMATFAAPTAPRPWRRMTRAEEDAVIYWRARGFSWAEIARRTGLNPGTVCNAWHRLERSWTVTPTERKHARAMRAQGMSHKDIATTIRRDRRTVAKMLEAAR